ncbi:hypothetical protein RB595_008009 [Gaeumannomyces hyphopodioides]
MFCSVSTYMNSGWQYYCITQARCRLCQFPFEDGEPAVADLGAGVISPWFEFHNDERCSDGKRRITVHMTRADRCSRDVVDGYRTVCSTPAVPFHVQCFNRRTGDASERFLEATAYWLAPSPTEEQRRSSRIQRLLATRLSQLLSPSGGFHAIYLPGDVWMMVADLLVRQCAALDAQIHVERQPKVEDSQVSLRRAVYASYVKFEGRHYIKTLYNQVEEANGVQTGSYTPENHFLVIPKYCCSAGPLRFPLGVKSSEHQTETVQRTEHQEKRANHRPRGGVWMACDHLGIRQMFHVPHDKEDAWNSRFPKLENCSWRYIPLGVDGFDDCTILVTSDGTKARKITSHKTRIHPELAPHANSRPGGARSIVRPRVKTDPVWSSDRGPIVHWPQPLFPVPTVTALRTGKPYGLAADTRAPRPRLMRSVNCNVPGTVGYCAAISPDRMAPLLIIPHAQHTSRDQWELCDQLTSMACQWIYFPLSPGERVMEVWKNRRAAFKMDGLVLLTNHQRPFVFGSFWKGVEKQKWNRIAKLPRDRPGQFFLEQPPTISFMPRGGRSTETTIASVDTLVAVEPATKGSGLAVANNNPPPMPTYRTIHPIDAGKVWYYAACSFERVTEVHICFERMRPRYGKPSPGNDNVEGDGASHKEAPPAVAGLLVVSLTGSRQCVGRFRPDMVGRVVRVGETDRLYFYRSLRGGGHGSYLSDVSIKPAAGPDDMSGLVVGQTGELLEWWFSESRNCLFYRGQTMDCGRGPVSNK